MRVKIRDMIKVLLDTNVLIDADKGAGSFGQRIIELVLNNKIIGVISRSVKNENNLLVNKLIKDVLLKKQILDYFGKCKKVESTAISVNLDDR